MVTLPHFGEAKIPAHVTAATTRNSTGYGRTRTAHTTVRGCIPLDPATWFDGCNVRRAMSRVAARNAVLVTTVAMMGCSGSIRATFQSTDPTFRPSPGPPPRIYLESNLHEVPETGFRSVGLIEVTVPESSGIQRMLDVAAKKGQELGCWILIEHSAFTSIES